MAEAAVVIVDDQAIRDIRRFHCESKWRGICFGSSHGPEWVRRLVSMGLVSWVVHRGQGQRKTFHVTPEGEKYL